MTIEEAIAQLKDLRKDREGFLKNDEPDSEFAKDIEAIDVAVKALEETAELKRLLRLALNDFEFIYDEHSCTGECECDTCCPYNMEKNRCLGKWKHAEEALKLLGDDADD